MIQSFFNTRGTRVHLSAQEYDILTFDNNISP